MKKFTPAQRHKMIKILISGCLVIIVSTLFAILPLRPERSESEKRPLAAFPSFSIKSLADGSYFSDISLWFSDTVPFRDQLIGINSKIQNFLGTDGAMKGFNEGKKGDDIPEPAVPQTPAAPENPTDSVVTQAPAVSENTTFPDDKKDAQNVEHLGNILVCDNSAFEYYNFVEDTARKYAMTINKAYSLMGSAANIYVAVAPTSTDITLNQKIRNQLSVSDQKKATGYILNSIVDGVKKIDCFDNIKMHRDEYIYFRTDHHWTALGAYYCYEIFCQQKGITPVPLENFDTISFPGFLGSFYNDSGKDPALSATPDEVIAYKPPCEYRMEITDKKGSSYEFPLLYDETNASAANKYSTFIGGDNPYSVIENLSMTEGESCIIVKDSYGNAFTPFLVSHYKYIYVIDFRHYTGTVSALAREKGVNDVIFMDNISMTRSKQLVNQLDAHL